MHTRLLGQTGLEVSRLGLGLAALGRPGYINLGHAEDLGGNYAVAAMEHRAHQVLDAARAAGITYVDAARSYGRSEAFVSSWLKARGIAAGEVIVGSKWGYTYTADWQVDADTHEVKDHSLPVLDRQIAESRAHLGAHLALYQVHSATLDSGILANGEVLDRLARLRDSGLAIGLSLSGPAQAVVLNRACAIKRGGRPLFTVAQATWNVLEPSAGAALAQAHAAGMGIVVKEGVANGRLTKRNRDPAIVPLLREAERLDTTPDALALAAVMAQPWCDVVLSGAATVAHLQNNLGALAVAWDAVDVDRLRALAEVADAYWARRKSLPWT